MVKKALRVRWDKLQLTTGAPIYAIIFRASQVCNRWIMSCIDGLRRGIWKIASWDSYDDG